MEEPNYKLAALIASQEFKLDRIYSEYSREIGFLFKNFSGRVTEFKKKQLETILARFHDDLEATIANQVSSSIDLSNKNTDLFTANYARGLNLKPSTLDSILRVNIDAASAFKERTIKGLNLSERVWSLTDQTQESLNQVLGSGVMNGRSAAEMAKDLKSYLKEPDRNYRRVRDANGKLVLSNPAKDYHPGRGVYRSSYKNALRLSRNEVNIAYRTNDYERRRDLPFVMGQNISLSGSHPRYDICDEMVGKYPKEFKFVGWHVNCLCISTAILYPRDKFKEYLGGKEIDKRFRVTGIPKNALTHINNNAQTINGWSNKPYFISDNFKFEKGVFVPSFGVGLPPAPPVSPPAPPAPKPRAPRKPKAVPVVPIAKALKKAPKKAPAVPKFIPATTLEEAEERVRKLGVPTVNFAGLKPHQFNAFLEAIEEEAAFSPLDGLKEIVTYKKRDGAQGFYYDPYKTIRLNLNGINKKHTPEILVPYAEKFKDISEKLAATKAKIGDFRYKQSAVKSNYNIYRTMLNEVEEGMKRGVEPTPWSMPAAGKNNYENLKGVFVHELGHFRHYNQLGLTKDFKFDPWTSVSTYGRTNFKEYLTEWYTYWRKNGDENVPADMLKLFNKLPRTK